MALVLGIDLGGTFIKAGLARFHEVVARDKRPTEADRGTEAVLGNIVAASRACLEAGGVGSHQIDGLCVAVPSPISPDRRTPVSTPNLKCLMGVPVAERVAQEVGCKGLIENDANAAVLGEKYFGVGQGSSDIVLLTLGTGVGGGVITGGQLLRGPRNASGELGHIGIVPGGRLCGCERRGCLEAHVSIGALIARGHALCPGLSLDEENGPRILADAARRGDAAAQQVFAEMGDYLGQGIVDLVNVFGPDVLVLSGGLSNCFDLFQSSMWQTVRKDCGFETLRDPLRIEVSQLGQDGPILGAAAAFLESIEERKAARP